MIPPQCYYWGLIHLINEMVKRSDRIPTKHVECPLARYVQRSAIRIITPRIERVSFQIYHLKPLSKLLILNANIFNSKPRFRFAI